MTIADGLVLLANTKEDLRVKLDMPKSAPFSTYVDSPLIPFTPRKLFSTGAEGVWYDPSDLSTLFQDATGTKPVTANGDPVGLMLDKSKGLELGVELTNDGEFTTNSWFVVNDGSYWIDGTYRVADIGGADSYMSQKILGTEIGKLYKIDISLLENTTSSLGFRIRTGINFGSAIFGDIFPNYVNNGVTTFYILAKGNDFYFSPHVSTTDTHVVIDSISIKEIKGNHATQSVSASRPTYQTDGILHWLAFDGVDDYIACVYADIMAQPNTVAIGFNFIDGNRIFSNAASGTHRQIMYSITAGTRWYAGDLDGDVGISPSQNTIVTGEFNGTSSFYRKNGGVNTVVNSGTNNTDGVTIAADYGGQYPSNMRFYGFVSVNRQIEYNELEQYLAQKSGVTL